MSTIVMDEKEEVVMKLVHYFVTKENYSPIVVNGVKNEVWLESETGPYKIIRINSNYIHNQEQYRINQYKIENITKQIKKKTLSFKMNVLNIELDVNERVKLESDDTVTNVFYQSLNALMNHEEVKEAFPDMKSQLIQNENAIDLIVNVTNDINEKTAKENEHYEKVFKEKKPVVTYGIMILCCILFGVQLLIPNIEYLFVNYAPYIKEGQAYRLLTYAFFHGSILHLLCNMYSLKIIGTKVESYMGKGQMLCIYIASALVGGLLSACLTSGYSLGASGAIFGLLGAILYFGYHYRLFLGSIIRTQIIPLILLNLFIGFTLPGIDNFCHIGGLAGGFLAAMAIGVPTKSTMQERVNGAIVLCALCGFLAYVLLFLK